MLPDEGVAPFRSGYPGVSLAPVPQDFHPSSTASWFTKVIEAHRRGIDVRVMLNPAKSDGLRKNDESFALLRASGVPIQWTSPEFVVTHEKSMVVDHTAYICTFNFSDKYFQRSRGYALVTSIAEEVEEVVAGFEADWKAKAVRSRKFALGNGGVPSKNRGSDRRRPGHIGHSAP